ncbi:MAG: hypothetical protein M5R36_24010 [Deltaproteobacteria bacterium]|nr:hypothetical protein [Deltaproteobacteria bacterium]
MSRRTALVAFLLIAVLVAGTAMDAGARVIVWEDFLNAIPDSWTVVDNFLGLPWSAPWYFNLNMYPYRVGGYNPTYPYGYTAWSNVDAYCAIANSDFWGLYAYFNLGFLFPTRPRTRN